MLASNAVLIIGDDEHLVRLSPWRGIPITTSEHSWGASTRHHGQASGGETASAAA